MHPMLDQSPRHTKKSGDLSQSAQEINVLQMSIFEFLIQDPASIQQRAPKHGAGYQRSLPLHEQLRPTITRPVINHQDFKIP